jgi:hypothetical protein
MTVCGPKQTIVRCDPPIGTLWNIERHRRSVRLHAREPNHLGPLLGVFGDELPVVGR